MKKMGLIALFAILPVAGAYSDAQQSIVFQGGDTAVTYLDIERYIAENMPTDPGEKAAVLNRPGIYKEMAEMLYTIRLLAAEAESQPDFDRQQAEWMARIMYQRRIIKAFRENYVRERLKDVEWEPIARETYQVQKKKYMTDELVKASHLLIKVDENRSEETAQALAIELRARALNGEDFGELARKYSDDPSAVRNSGSLGFFKRGQLAKPFEEVVFAMQEPGSLSEPVKTSFGYHVIRFESRKPPEQIPFDSAKEKIIDELQTDMGNKLWQDKLVAIRSNKDLIIDEQLLRQLQEQYQTDPKGK
jgi:parvulin-like peptidyl-prolyl isomerase